LNSNNELGNSNANVRTLKYIKKIITDKKSRAEPYLLVKYDMLLKCIGSESEDARRYFRKNYL